MVVGKGSVVLCLWAVRRCFRMASTKLEESNSPLALVELRIVHILYLPLNSGTVALEIDTHQGLKSIAPRVSNEGTVVFNSWVRVVAASNPFAIKVCEAQSRQGMKGLLSHV